MCTFWLVEALTRAGRTDRARLEEARLLFEQMLGYANHLGLYAEQTGASGEALGNFPQAFTHLALISAAFNLDRALGGQRYDPRERNSGAIGRAAWRTKMTEDRADESLPEVAMPHCEVRKTLTGQKALVTGASSGIGKGVALALGRAGADVVVNYASQREPPASRA